jgi:hypothetical protein
VFSVFTEVLFNDVQVEERNVRNSSEVFRKKILDVILDRPAPRNRRKLPAPTDTTEM